MSSARLQVHHALLVARREVRLLLRSRIVRRALMVLAVLAWLPVILVPLRQGRVAIAAFDDLVPLALAVLGVTIPLLALLTGAETIAGEFEDHSLLALLLLPISRTALLAGKCLGRLVVFSVAFLVAFGSAALVVLLVRGRDGGSDYLALCVATWLLALVCGGLGCLVGVLGQTRLRSFGAALVAWMVLVFAIDAMLLAGLVATEAPQAVEVGGRGHSELAAPTGAGSRGARVAPWSMSTSPVSLFRLTVLSMAPGLRDSLPPLGLRVPAALLALGWAAWLVVPLSLAAGGFRHSQINW